MLCFDPTPIHVRSSMPGVHSLSFWHLLLLLAVKNGCWTRGVQNLSGRGLWVTGRPCPPVLRPGAGGSGQLQAAELKQAQASSRRLSVASQQLQQGRMVPEQGGAGGWGLVTGACGIGLSRVA